ncbi:hypothetical protein D3Y59_08525 [Hymenobacter oligotrophus]|uniref:Uncharacterized protein n=1 Tax=Hymenobacter oligotrophus TaxID=2319843 RepID=A0A3B7QZQ0_9BACT|nr:hypothetical protein [Hymenobacter oligotrophus]AYA37095.1 hypothetical protein D3Y59_08525 [Hymenobacter oligotrophus]
MLLYIARLRFALWLGALGLQLLAVVPAQAACALDADWPASRGRVVSDNPAGVGKPKRTAASPHTHTDSTRLVVFHRPVSTQPDVEVSVNGDVVGNIADKGYVLVPWPSTRNELSLCPTARAAACVSVHPQHCRVNYYELVPGYGKHAATLKPVSAKEGEFYMRLLQQRAQEQTAQAASR